MLKLLVFTLSSVLSLSAATRVELKVGDILLQPLDCWSCNLIEAEEQSIYSHMGIVMRVHPTVMVAEARGAVNLVSLQAFNSITQKNQKVLVLRFRNEAYVKKMSVYENALNELFARDFEGRKYDHDFLWDNVDENGEEKLYCSEMVSKLLQSFLGTEPIIKRMTYSRHYDAWVRYFRGPVPVGKWGNAPADFEKKTEWFSVVGEL